jgi:hypothetical protein
VPDGACMVWPTFHSMMVLIFLIRMLLLYCSMFQIPDSAGPWVTQNFEVLNGWLADSVEILQAS